MIGTEHRLLMISFSVAVFSAFFCMILLLIRLTGERLDKFVKRIILLLIAIYIIEIIYLLTVFIYNFDPENFFRFKTLNFFITLMLPVVFYHLVFKLTRLQDSESFSLWNYALPFSLTILYGIWAFIIPGEIYRNIDDRSLDWMDGYRGFFLFNYSRFYIRISIGLVYIYLSIKRLIHYKNVIVHYSSDIETSSLAWVYQIFWTGLFIFPFPILYYFISTEICTTFIGLLIPVTLVLTMNVTMCYNIFRQNFILLTENIIADRFSEEKKESLNHEEFFKYMSEEKPYLNPYLKITDLIPVFGTNRTYLSAFINTTYKLNFSMYINKFRLEEFYRLRGLPENKDIGQEELAYFSGFRSFQSLKRSEKILKSQKR